MAIVFGSDMGIKQDGFEAFSYKITSEFNRIKTGIFDNFSRLTGESAGLPPPPYRENVFIQDGFSNAPASAFVGSQIDNVDDIKTRRIITQEPQLTVYIKKRMFSSLRNEYDTKFMDPGEKLFLRASKILFENKCSQIAAYEALTKASKLISEESELDATRIETLVSLLEQFFGEVETTLVDDAQEAFSVDINNEDFDLTNFNRVQQRVNEFVQDRKQFQQMVGGLRTLTNNALKTKQATQTNWVIDDTDDVVGAGRGVGTIELTLISNISTNLSLNSGDKGSFNFTIEDPYNITKITSDDIEIALAGASKETNDIANQVNLDIISSGPQVYLENARRKEETLRRLRENRIKNFFSIGPFELGNPNVSLSGGNIAEIIFEVNPTSFAKNKVTGSVTNLPERFNKDTFRLAMLQLPTLQQLTPEEDRLVVDIFDALESYVGRIELLTDSILEDNNNPDLIYARRNMRSQFLGKNIVQPMDVVNVYIRGKTFNDTDLVGPLTALLEGTAFFQSFADSDVARDAVLEEEMRQFGIDKLGIPVGLYRVLRTSSFMRNAGIQVFGGVVSSAAESYRDGSYNLNISGESNLKYLDLSRVNVAPSLDQREGVLEDPLTPFDIVVDPGTGLIASEPQLLSVNKQLISEGKLFYNSGERAGEKVENVNLLEQDVSILDNLFLPIDKHVPGLVYRWKQGIIAISQNVNLRTALDGSGIQSAKLRRDVGLTIVEEPFANVDAADVVSLLVTGFPHNYESFFLSTRSTGTYKYGGQANSPESFFHSFFDITRSTNRALGNFQPFKTITISRQQMAERLKLQTDLTTESKKLNELRAVLAELKDQYNAINTRPSQLVDLGVAKQNVEEGQGDPDLVAELEKVERRRQSNSANLINLINATQAEIDKLTKQFNEKIQAGEKVGLRIYGNDIAFEFDTTNDEELKENNKNIRLKNSILQLRTQLQCKYNEDTNLFIVSDDYDKDLTIQAFALRALSSKESPLWNSHYKHPLDICVNVAKTLDFEFFCSTQGHIEFRAPKYNKVPLSLLLKLFTLDQRQNKKLYPEFLESLFKSKKQSFEDEAKNVDLQIQAERLLLGQRPEVSSNTNQVVNDESGDGLVNIKAFIDSSTPSISAADAKNLAITLIGIRNTLSTRIGSKPIPLDVANIDATAKEISTLNNPSTPNVNALRLTKINNLSKLISRKEKINSIINRLSSENSFDSAVNVPEKLGIKGSDRLTPSDMNEILLPFADLVEDDFVDFLGPGSAKRFIIQDDQIIDYNFTESDTNVFCRVDITGEQDLSGEGEGLLGGIQQMWAGATDFDLWRQYGWRSEGSYNKPFFKDAELQCAPYALMLLTRAKKDAVRGSITVIGNEYYQLGDVVYINSRDMLYYVVGVRHDFSYAGGTFTTTLDLRYGHALGEYIPTPLDVIGKTLIKNQRQFNTRITARETANKRIGTLLGTVVFRKDNTSEIKSDIEKEMLSGGLGIFNLDQLKNALIKAGMHITETSDFPQLEIRGYMFEESEFDKVRARMNVVKDWLASPIVGVNENGYVEKLPETDFPPIYESKIKKFTDDDPINLTELSENNKNKLRFPKEEAYNVVRDRNINDVVEILLVWE